jgi:hypothetical protein
MHKGSLLIKDSYGLTPLDVAKLNNKTKFLKEIKKFLKGRADGESNINRH